MAITVVDDLFTNVAHDIATAGEHHERDHRQREHEAEHHLAHDECLGRVEGQNDHNGRRNHRYQPP